MNIKNYPRTLLLSLIVIFFHSVPKTYASVIEDLNDGESKTKVLTTLEQHRNVLKEVLEKATERVIIVSPYISEYALSADQIVKIIQTCTDKNIDITIYIDSKLDREFNKTTLKPNAKVGRQTLREVEVDFRILDKIHAKVLIKDEDLIVIGSFNWLSAIRDSNHRFANHEQSIVVMGYEADNLIKTSLKGIETVSEISTPYSKAHDATKADKSDYLDIAMTLSGSLYDKLSNDDQMRLTWKLEKKARSSSDESGEDSNSDETSGGSEEDSGSDVDNDLLVMFGEARSKALKDASKKSGNDG